MTDPRGELANLRSEVAQLRAAVELLTKSANATESAAIEGARARGANDARMAACEADIVRLSEAVSMDPESLNVRVRVLEEAIKRKTIATPPPVAHPDLAAVLLEDAKARKETSGAVKAIATAAAKFLAIGGLGTAAAVKAVEWGGKAIEWVREALGK